MRLLFLDIDGVLNSKNWQSSLPAEELSDRIQTKDLFDPKAVSRVNTIIAATQADVVISSTWRLVLEWEKLVGLLQKNKLGGNIIGRTPCKMSNYNRGIEIKWFLDGLVEQEGYDPGTGKELTLGGMVILDDGGDMFSLNHRLVRTSWDWGIQDRHIDQAIDLLKIPFTHRLLAIE